MPTTFSLDLPRFTTPLYVGRPNIGDPARLNERIAKMIESRWLTNDGLLVKEFESRIAAIAGVKHCIVMNNATVGLEIATRSVGLTGEVIVPSYTFVATAHALQWQQITPVFCDIDPVTQNIDPARIEQLITPRTTGIIGVHLWGRGCDVERLQAIASKHGLALILDAAHAFACSQGGKMIGGFGHAEVFSFHATKFIQSGEGGAVVTNDDNLATKMRLMRNFGFSGYDNVVYVGTNGKMNELSAAMGLTSLDSLEMFLQVNRMNYEAYCIALRGLPGISVIEYPTDEKQNLQYVVLDVNPQVCPLSRDQLVQVLHAHNVIARRYFYPGTHRMEPYRSYYPNAHLLLPVTEQVTQRVIVLPTGTSVTTADIEQIGKIMRWGIEHASQLRNQLRSEIPPGGSFVGT